MAIQETADEILRRARERSDERDSRRQPVDYAALNAMVRRHRAALTRAINSKSADKVVMACRNAVREWNKPGSMWPDDWSRWQRALNDVLPLGKMVSLEDLD